MQKDWELNPALGQERYHSGHRVGRQLFYINTNSFLSVYLFFRRRLQGGGCSLVPPGQRGAEPFNFTQVYKEGAVGAIHTVEAVARVGGPTSAHPL